MTIQWTTEMDEVLREAIEAQERMKAIAKELEVSELSIKRRAKVLGLKFKKGPAPNHILLSRILTLVGDGVDTCGKLARRMDCTRTMAKRHVRRLIEQRLVRRVGNGCTTRLVLTKRWCDSYKGL